MILAKKTYLAFFEIFWPITKKVIPNTVRSAITNKKTEEIPIGIIPMRSSRNKAGNRNKAGIRRMIPNILSNRSIGT
jgi:hypothetical protein